MELVQEVMGQRYSKSQADEIQEYDDLVMAYCSSHAGVKERATRKADLQALQVDALLKAQWKARDQREAAKIASHLAYHRSRLRGYRRRAGG